MMGTSNGFQMIRTIDIKNFRCFQHLRIENCAPINVIVGDNGSGKTALLEALFLALGATSELGVRFRQQRGFEGAFNGPPRKIEEAIWRDFFYNREWGKTLAIELSGDGPEARSVRIYRGASQLSIPFGEDSQKSEQLSGGVAITWKDANGVERTARPTVSTSGAKFEGTEEDLPDFFYFAANQMPSSNENAGRFSELSRAGRASEFKKIITNEYDWIDDLSIEVAAGAPIIYATLKGNEEKIPLPNISGGINRIIGIMLSIASRSRSVVIVDEMEDGIYYKHHESLWRALLSLARGYITQLFVTTHSEEWLKALVKATKGDTNDIALWRMERDEQGKPELLQFDGEALTAGIKHNVEVRGDADGTDG